MLKILSNDYFLTILLDKKRGRDRYLEKKGVKIRAAFFEDALLIVLLYWPILCFFKTSISVCRENYIGKSRWYGASTANTHGRADNSGTNLVDGNRGTDNPGAGPADKKKRVDHLDIGIADKNKRGNNLNTGKTDRDKRANNSGTDTGVVDNRPDDSGTDIRDIYTNGGAKNSCTRIAVTNTANNLSKDVDRVANGQAAGSNKVRVSLFFI